MRCSVDCGNDYKIYYACVYVGRKKIPGLSDVPDSFLFSLLCYFASSSLFISLTAGSQPCSAAFVKIFVILLDSVTAIIVESTEYFLNNFVVCFLEAGKFLKQLP